MLDRAKKRSAPASRLELGFPVTKFDAVVFDFGGVIITPLTVKIGQMAERAGTSMVELLEVLMGSREKSSDHPWHRCERGELAVAEMQPLLSPYAAAAGVDLVGDEIELLFEQNYRFNTNIVERIRSLRPEYRVGLLTNSVREFRPSLEAQLDLSLFDAVIDSSVVGCRKPEPRIYALTAETLGVEPRRILYLDDFLGNLHGAREAGWTTIHVADPVEALIELDELLSLARPA